MAKTTDLKNDGYYSGIYDTTKEDRIFDRINRFGYLDPYNAITHTKEYLFFTKPDLHLLKSGEVIQDELQYYPFFQDMLKKYVNVMKQLQSSASKTGPFINMLGNTVKSSLDLPGISTREIDTPATIYGTAISYEAENSASDEAHEFSLEFRDSKYLEVYMFFKCWNEYMKKKSYGLITPKNPNYRLYKILHDQIAIYKFIVGEDNETILYYAKLYGCRPKGVPRESFSDLDPSGGISYSVPWKAEFIEDMDPLILYDFNLLTKSRYEESKKNLPLYDIKNDTVESRWAMVPFIYTENGLDASALKSKKYKLKWAL